MELLSPPHQKVWKACVNWIHTRKMWPANLIVKTILFSIRWQRRGLKFLIREPLELYFDGILNMYNAGNLKKSMSLCSLDRYLFYECSHIYTCTFYIYTAHIHILRAESFVYKCIVNILIVYVITRFFKRVNSKKIGLKIFFYLQTVYNLGRYLLLITQLTCIWFSP